MFLDYKKLDQLLIFNLSKIVLKLRYDWLKTIFSPFKIARFMRCSFSIALTLIGFTAMMANDLQISNIRAVNRGVLDSDPPSVVFDLSWKNAWRNSKNHDAAWIHVKFNGWNPQAKLAPSGHRVLDNRVAGCADPLIVVSKDSLGLFVLPSEDYRGDIDIKLKILFDTTSQEISWSMIKNKFNVYGYEMVYIPEGPFKVGNPEKESISRAGFYRSSGDGQFGGPFEITSEEAIEVGPEQGMLYYWSEEELYNGDQDGPVPAAFPKGYHDFYVMKYELTQGQYADFLNAIFSNYTYERSPIGGLDYYKKRGGIRLIDGRYAADNPNRPMNFVSFTDGLAFTDWACLRPITELEYTKAARGPRPPSPFEFVWGTDNYNRLARYVRVHDLILDYGLDEGQLTDDNLDVYGASYFWVMDLSGSLWEKVITVGNQLGRTFTGSHGDGIIEDGAATNSDWPKSDKEVGGFGYRGGGFYEPDTEYSDFNPHSPTGYRYYGAWSGGPRSIAYGYRAGRTAD